MSSNFYEYFDSKTISVPGSILDQKDSNLLLTYIGIQAITRQFGGDRILITQPVISFYLYGNTTFHAKEIRDNLKLLHYQGFIMTNSENKYFVLDNSYQLDPPFFAIKLEDVLAILDSSFRNKTDLIYFYCYIIKSINTRSKIGFTSIDTFAKKLNVDRKTIMHRENELAEIGVIKFYSSSINHKKYYCRTADQQVLESVIGEST